MGYRGKVTNGVVVLADGKRLWEGTEVRVEPVEADATAGGREVRSSLFRAGERAKPTGIPDLAANQDHCL